MADCKTTSRQFTTQLHLGRTKVFFIQFLASSKEIMLGLRQAAGTFPIDSKAGGAVIRMFEVANKSIFYSFHLLRNGKVSLNKGFTNGKKVRVKELMSVR